MNNFETYFQYDDQRYEDSQIFAIKSDPVSTNQHERKFYDHQSCQNDVSFLDNSFEELSNQHPQAIEQAFINLKDSASIDRENENFGLQDFQIKNHLNSSPDEHKTIKSLILQSNLISQKNKKQFLDDLKRDTILNKTIKGLIYIFDDQTIKEVVYFIERGWQKYLEIQKQFIIKKPIIPMFTKIKDFDSFNSLQNHPQKVARFNIPKDLLFKQANQLAENLQQVLYYDNRIKMLNLRSCFQKIKNQKEHIKNFGKLLKVLFKAVFLSAEGEFQHPQEQEEQPYKRSYNSRLMNSFSQDQQDNQSESQDASIRYTPQKKRKTI